MLTQGASEGFNLTLQHKTLDQSNLKLMSSMTDAIFREAIIIKKKHSDFFPISELPILPFHMWFGFRISSPFHLDVLVHPVP